MTLANYPDLVDHINDLRDRLHLLALAARSLQDPDDANAMHLGACRAAKKADEIKVLLMGAAGAKEQT